MVDIDYKELVKKFPNTKIKKNKDGSIIYASSFFYRTQGRQIAQLEVDIKSMFPEAEIIDKGDNWKAFRGGASFWKQSYHYVKFKLVNNNE